MVTKTSASAVGEATLKGKRVFVRVDLNVTFDCNYTITDDTRVHEAVPTIQSLTENGAKVILCSHLGSLKGVTPKYILKPIVSRLSELLGSEVKMANDSIGEEVEKLVADLPEGGVLLLDNVRFNDPEFLKKLALADVYVKDSCGTADRHHASTELINNDDLEELRRLGSGTYGTVYHGKWRGAEVAIKRFNILSSKQEKLTAGFRHEAEILSKLHHPNVLAFYGAVQDGPGGTFAIITEFMVDGSLRHVLEKDRHLDHGKRLLIAMDAAFGMEFLHLKNVVHFDLKSENLLVNFKDHSRPICKVGDFGLSKIKRNTLVSGGLRGTLPWIAPELLNGNSKVSEKVDVYSFGITLWEILTGEEPYANIMPVGAIIGGVLNGTLRPPIPSECDSELRILMEQCWAPNPAARPSFTEIAGRLRSLAAAWQN